ncbi:hypothetical protein BaRGS_00039223, partial [Batillaria attramentaria]
MITKPFLLLSVKCPFTESVAKTTEITVAHRLLQLSETCVYYCPVTYDVVAPSPHIGMGHAPAAIGVILVLHFLCYLAIFRLDELGSANFHKFIQCLDVSAAYTYLNFFLQEKNLLTWIKDGWSTIYESSFVKSTLLDPLLRWLPDLQEI